MSDDVYRYGKLRTGSHAGLVLRDDGYRFEYWASPASKYATQGPGEWMLWASYEQCDHPGVGGDVADVLFAALEPCDDPEPR